MSGKVLKVLSVCISDNDGGASRAAFRIHESVRAQGVDSQMLVMRKRGCDDTVFPVSDYLPSNSLYKTLEWFLNKIRNKLQHRRWKRYPEKEDVYMSDLRGTDLKRVLRKFDYDILHLHWINQRFVRLEQLPHDKPVIWTLHDCWAFSGVCHYSGECEGYKDQCGCCPYLHSSDRRDLSHRVWRRKASVYKNLDLHIIAPSRWLADCAVESSLLRSFPVDVIPNGLDEKVFMPMDEKDIAPRWKAFVDDSTSKHFILYGAMKATTDRRKGFEYLISSLKVLEETGSAENMELIVFGAKGAELSIEVNIPVHYVGYIKDTDELASLYNVASVMVVPSLYENLSCAIMEALSCGTPVAAFDIGGNGDMIDHKENGYLARKGDSADLASGISWCIEKNKDGHMSKAARDKILFNFTNERIGQIYKKVYEKVLQR